MSGESVTDHAAANARFGHEVEQFVGDLSDQVAIIEDLGRPAEQAPEPAAPEPGLAPARSAGAPPQDTDSAVVLEAIAMAQPVAAGVLADPAASPAETRQARMMLIGGVAVLGLIAFIAALVAMTGPKTSSAADGAGAPGQPAAAQPAQPGQPAAAQPVQPGQPAGQAAQPPAGAAQPPAVVNPKDCVAPPGSLTASVSGLRTDEGTGPNAGGYDVAWQLALTNSSSERLAVALKVAQYDSSQHYTGDRGSTPPPVVGFVAPKAWQAGWQAVEPGGQVTFDSELTYWAQDGQFYQRFADGFVALRTSDTCAGVLSTATDAFDGLATSLASQIKWP